MTTLRYTLAPKFLHKREPHKRAYLSENGGLGKTDQENGPKDETEKATGLGRRTREEI